MDTLLSLSWEYTYILIPFGILVADLPTLLIIGFLINQGTIKFLPSIILAILSRGIFELLLFRTGRVGRTWKIFELPYLKKQQGRASNLLVKHQAVILLFYHFIQGIKLAVPIAAGLSSIRTKYFATLNILGLVIWSSLFIGLGWYAHESVLELLNFFS